MTIKNLIVERSQIKLLYIILPLFEQRHSEEAFQVFLKDVCRKLHSFTTSVVKSSVQFA